MSTLNILFKFPTRSRPDKFFKVLDIYYGNIVNMVNSKFIITCDSDDITMNNDLIISKLKEYKNLEFFFGENKSKIQAVNSDMDNVDFDIVVLVSDDMIPKINGFDDIIRNKMSENFQDLDGVLWFNDGLQGRNLNTLCILGKKYYDRFNYFYHPSYKSLWCDNEFTLVANTLGKQIYFESIIIRHEHSSLTSSSDGLDIVNDSYNNEDMETFYRRRNNNFKN